MPDRFNVSQLPGIDQQVIKKGYCPWCYTARLYPSIDEEKDTCSECLDEFVGDLNIDG